jgi:hypothetical protein
MLLGQGFGFGGLGGPPVAGGGNDANTLLLLHMDGTDGGTTFTDDSVSSHTAVANGFANTDDVQKKFGTTSAELSTLASYVTITDGLTDFDPGSGNFTVDWWEYRTSIADYTTSISRDVSGTYSPYILGFGYSSTLTWYMTSNGSAWDVCNGRTMDATPTLNDWVHWAVVRNGTTFTAYKDGVQSDTFESAAALNAGAQNFAVGKSNLNGFTGWIDEVRYSDVARWTTGFTPPAGAYT